ncbi:MULTISPECIES: helix-turn-helix domain-containing protein [unclassified Bradyrhizobium]|uniref:helix-turn-helix domain-containing protein n=1 Tax=unclassified Bradyrhizobium TaxID=2631580 RepID=UPI002915C96C|nr:MULTISPECIES: helix-turn-helix domain-containing protein [unclassified Bradyrhizobium]
MKRKRISEPPQQQDVVETEIKTVSSLVPSFGFSSEGMETEANIAAWRAAVSTFFEVDELAANEPGPFRADVRSFAMGSVLFGLARASGQHFRRDTHTIARSGVDHVIIQAYVRGGYHGTAGERPIRVTAGDICVLDLAQTFETWASPFENLTLVIPRPMFDARLLQMQGLHGLVLAANSPLTALLARHLEALLDYAPRMSFEECQAVVEGTVSLVSACIRGEIERRDAERIAPEETSLFRIRQYIETQLSSADLNTESVAAHFGLSRASLYRLFAPLGGIAEYIRSRRLHRAFFDLVGSRNTRISEVARRWQLGTDAHFARSFKAAYGITPRAAREAALLGSQQHASEQADPGLSTLTRWMRGIAPPREE